MSDSKKPAARPVPPRHVLRRISTHAPALGVLLPLTLVDVAIDGGITLSYKYLIDRAIVPSNGRALAIVLGVLFGGVVFGGALTFYRDLFHARLVARVLDDVRRMVFAQAQKLSVGYYAGRSTGELVARFSTDLAALETTLVGAVGGVLLPLAGIVVGSCLLFFVLDWHLALVGTLIWPLVLVGPRSIAPRAADAAYARKQDEANVLAVVEEAAAAHRLVKAYGLDGYVRERFETALGPFSKKAVRAAFLGSLVERTTVITIYAVQVVMIAAGAYMAYEGMLTVGALVAFLTLFWNLGWSVVVLGRSAPGLVAAAGSMTRIDELLEEPTDPVDAPDAIELPPLREAVRFDSVLFGYGRRGAVLAFATFGFERGEQVAFVGASGSGKTTIMSLLARFHDPLEGTVTIDGVDVRKATTASLRAQMGIVLQETFLFDGTIRENIAIGKLGATADEIERAARAAEIHDAIATFPQGYDTQVGSRGALLSGGQRQRIAIARALLRDAPILLLDEATSALDPATEAAINETLFRAAAGRTTVVVTHRLASVTRADRIFVLDTGRIVEKGTHEALLAKNGVYADLWRKQNGFVVSGDGASAEVTPERLRHIALLEPLPDAQLAKLASQFASHRAPAGSVVLREGEKGDLFYLVARGVVTVSHTKPDGTTEELARLSDGDQFGEMALLWDAPRSATVTARTDCLFLTLTRQQFVALLDTTPDVRTTVERIARRRNAQLKGTPMARTLC